MTAALVERGLDALHVFLQSHSEEDSGQSVASHVRDAACALAVMSPMLLREFQRLDPSYAGIRVSPSEAERYLLEKVSLGLIAHDYVTAALAQIRPVSQLVRHTLKGFHRHASLDEHMSELMAATLALFREQGLRIAPFCVGDDVR